VERAWVHEGAERDGSWAFLAERTVVARRVVVVEVKARVAAGRRASAIENRAMIMMMVVVVVLVTVGSLYDESFDCICELIAMLPIKLRVVINKSGEEKQNVTLVAKRFDVLQSRNANPPTLFHLPNPTPQLVKYVLIVTFRPQYNVSPTHLFPHVLIIHPPSDFLYSQTDKSLAFCPLGRTNLKPASEDQNPHNHRSLHLHPCSTHHQLPVHDQGLWFQIEGWLEQVRQSRRCRKTS